MNIIKNIMETLKEDNKAGVEMKCNKNKSNKHPFQGGLIMGLNNSVDVSRGRFQNGT